MIRLRMLKTAAGPLGSFAAGSVVELDEDAALAFVESGAAEPYLPKRVKASPATRTDAELLAEYENDARAAGYAEPGVKSIAQARLLALRENIPYDEASARLSKAQESASKPATTEDPLEAERQAQFKELVDGGLSEGEARELVWPSVERAVRTPPERATGRAARR
jgi:hypothetical protein